MLNNYIKHKKFSVYSKNPYLFEVIRNFYRYNTTSLLNKNYSRASQPLAFNGILVFARVIK